MDSHHPSPSSSDCETVIVERRAPLVWIRIHRPRVRNAVDRETAQGLYKAFVAFEADESLSVALLSSSGDHFCGGADLRKIALGDPNRLEPFGSAPMGPIRMRLTKPVIAVVRGYAVAGGLELALWADLRVCDESAKFGVFCRRVGVPLIDGGTIRLARILGRSRALDLLLTGREIDSEEALSIGLVNRVFPTESLDLEAEKLALLIASFPQLCLRSDRLSLLEQESIPDESEALRNEFARGKWVLSGSSESTEGAIAFSVERQGRSGASVSTSSSTSLSRNHRLHSSDEPLPFVAKL